MIDAMTVSWLLIAAVFLLNLYFMSSFLSYCRRVEHYEDKNPDYSDPDMVDDGSDLTLFQQKQYWSLVDGSFRDIDDAYIVATGSRLAKLMWWTHALTVIGVLQLWMVSSMGT